MVRIRDDPLVHAVGGEHVDVVAEVERLVEQGAQAARSGLEREHALAVHLDLFGGEVRTRREQLRLDACDLLGDADGHEVMLTVPA